MNLTTHSDGNLLAQYLTQRQDAFDEIMRRHGGMVLGVCRSVLGNTADAEDATQAVFLTLINKASSLRNHPTLAGWLHRVAWYVAIQAKKSMKIRTLHEREAANMLRDQRSAKEESVPLDMVHAALFKLPEKYRLPIILHHLEGRSQEEIAGLLDSNVGVVAMRLNRGRQMLRDKIGKTGSAFSAAGLAAAMANQAPAEMTSACMTSISKMASIAITAKGAIADAASVKVIALSRAAVNMMFMAKLRVAAVITAAIMVLGGTAMGVYISTATEPKNNVPAALSGGLGLSVDCSRKYQTIVGLGTCGMHWTGNMPPNLYESKEVQKLFVDDLGASMVRWAVPSDVLPNEIPDPKDISYKQFVVKPGSRSAINYVASVYAANPREMTVVASVWSPPAWMKTNNSVVNGGSLRPDRIEHYAKYLAEWVLYMKEVMNTPVHYFSIQNEPSFTEPYDSCVYKADLYAQTVLAVCDAFKAAKLDTRLFGPEEMTWNVSSIQRFISPVLQDQRGRERFTAVASHGYSDGVRPASGAREAAKLWQALQPLGVQWWMTETSGTMPGFMGEGRDKNGNPNPGAFNLANQIHNALVYGNASAWVYWCISGHAKSLTDNAAKEALMNGEKPYKKFYVSKQFFKFIRPGAVRVDTGPDGESGIQISSFLHEKNKTLTIVLINYNIVPIEVSLDVKSAETFIRFEAYRTTENEDCIKLDDSVATGGKIGLILPPQAVVTLLGTGSDNKTSEGKTK